MNFQKNSSRCGSALIGVLILVMLLSVSGGAYLQVALNEYRQSIRNVQLQASLNVAEAGVEEAIHAMRHENWTDWTSLGSGIYHRTFPTAQYFNNRTQIRVLADLRNANNPVLVSEGSVETRSGWIQKQVLIELGRRSLFAIGLTARNTVRFNGNRVQVDSFDSRNGPYDVLLNRNDRGSVGSIAVSVDAVDIQNADVLGFVATGGSSPQVGTNGSVLGFGSPSGAKIDATRITTDFYADLPIPTDPTLPSGTPTSLPGNIIGNPLEPNKTQYYKLSELTIGNRQKIQVVGNVVLVVDGNVDIKGELEVFDTGNLRMYVKGDMDVGGNGVVNSTQSPQRMLIYGTNPTVGAQEFKLHGNGAVHGAIYAPNADLSLRGGGHSGSLFGAAVAYGIVINGTYSFHYDEALGDFSDDDSFRIQLWRELIGADERFDFDEPSTLTQKL
jgi:hypothetical protein